MGVLLLALFLTNPGFDFLLIPSSPKGPEATREGVESILFNPAGLAESGGGVLLYQNFWLLDSKASFLGLKWNTWGIKLAYYDFGQLEFQEAFPQDEGGPVFNPYALRIGIGVGRKIDPELKIGGELNYLYEKILFDFRSNLFVNLGVFYTPLRFPKVSLGISVANLGLKAHFRDVDDKMPTELLISLRFNEKKINTTYSFKKVTSYNVPFSELEGLGIEHILKGEYTLIYGFSLFASYTLGREIDKWALGLAYKKGYFNLLYSYRISSLNFDVPHILGLNLEFP